MKISKRVAIPCLFLFFAFLFGCSQRNSQEISLPSSPTPLHGALLQSNNIELSWNPAEHSEGLQLLYSIFLSFEGGEFLQVASDLPFPSFSLSHLKPGTYTWKVTARTGALGVSSPEWLFSIDAETIPQLADPDDGVTEPELLVSDVQNNSISLQWPRFLVPSDPDQVITYVVSLFPSDQSAMLPRAQIHTEATGTVFSGLFTGETYTFEIVAQAQNGNTGTLGQGTVTPGNHRPSRPELLFPQDKEQGLPGSFLLSWEASQDPDGDAVRYEVYAGNHPQQMSRITPEGGVAGTTFPISLDDGQMVYWQVLAKDGKGGTASSEKWRFSTACSIPIPCNPFPLDHTFDIDPDASLTLSWECEHGLYYDLFLGKNNPHLKLEASNLQLTSYTLDVPTLEEKKRYYWQVVAKEQPASARASVQGPIWDFKTGDSSPPPQLQVEVNFTGEYPDALEVPLFDGLLDWHTLAVEFSSLENLGEHFSFALPNSAPLVLDIGEIPTGNYQVRIEALGSTPGSISGIVFWGSLQADLAPEVSSLDFPTFLSPGRLDFQPEILSGEPLSGFSIELFSPTRPATQLFFPPEGGEFFLSPGTWQATISALDQNQQIRKQTGAIWFVIFPDLPTTLNYSLGAMDAEIEIQVEMPFLPPVSEFSLSETDSGVLSQWFYPYTFDFFQLFRREEGDGFFTPLTQMVPSQPGETHFSFEDFSAGGNNLYEYAVNVVCDGMESGSIRAIIQTTRDQ